MRMRCLATIALLLFAAAAGAEECPSGEAITRARNVIADLQRIVTPDGIQETYRQEIGGIPQWINIRGKHRDNPVILFVHGGPASPSMPSHWQFQRPWEEFFTVVHWDQRGAGKTFLASDPEAIADTIRIERYVADAIEVAEHVRDRLGKDKLLLVGHSWGTIVGMHAALERPDLFHAYVGMGQVIDVRENERLSVEYALARARQDANAEAVAELEAIMPYPGEAPITRERIVIARKWPQHYGGLNAYRDAEQDYYYGAGRLSPEYDCRDQRAFFDGNVFTLGKILDEFLRVDFSDVHEFPIPVVMFMGRHDYTTPSAPTAAWLEQVDAPYKRGVWFEDSAHMIPWEEPGKVLVTLLDVVSPLATKVPAP